MTRQEDAVNESLCALDEAHRLGHITQAEYRTRRRYVVGRLADANGETARNTATTQGNAVTARNHHDHAAARPAADTDAMRVMFPARTRLAWTLVGALVVLVLLAVIVYVLLGRS